MKLVKTLTLIMHMLVILEVNGGGGGNSGGGGGSTGGGGASTNNENLPPRDGEYCTEKDICERYTVATDTWEDTSHTCFNYC